MQKTELQSKMNQAYKELAAALDGLDPEEATQPTLTENWSVREAIAHIVGWEREGLTQLAEVAQNTWTARPLDSASVDEFNDRAVADRAGKTMQELLAELAVTHNELELSLSAMPDELDKSSVEYGVIKGVAVNHARHHARQIMRWRQGLAAASPAEG